MKKAGSTISILLLFCTLTVFSSPLAAWSSKHDFHTGSHQGVPDQGSSNENDGDHHDTKHDSKGSKHSTDSNHDSGLLSSSSTIRTADSGCLHPGQCTCDIALGVMTDHAMAPPLNRINNGCTHDA
jgi:hypothetical protein